MTTKYLFSSCFPSASGGPLPGRKGYDTNPYVSGISTVLTSQCNFGSQVTTSGYREQSVFLSSCFSCLPHPLLKVMPCPEFHIANKTLHPTQSSAS